MPAAKKPTATKKAPAKPAATKTAPAKKSAAKTPVKAPAKKTVSAKKAVARPAAKTTPKKATAAKAAPKKTAVAKAAPKKPTAKAAPKKAAAKKAENPIDALVKALEKALDMNKAEEIVSINLAGRSSLADYMIVASGRSARQVAALANYVQGELAKQGYKKMRVEGLPQGDWVIVDSGDVVIHLFRPEVREFYQLEKLWSDDDTDQPTTRISLR